jgi:ribokinase
MKRETTDERFWPYVLPFPLDTKKRGLIWSILQSRVGLKILRNVSVDKRTYQHDLIEKLPYSNKSIIKYLKMMVKAGILEQGMEVSMEKRRTVWIKWYRPTSLGKWLILFLKPPSEVSPDLTKTVIEELFRLYSSSIVEACQRYGMDIDSFHQDLDKQYLLEVSKERPQIKPEVAVFGSAALDIYGTLKKLPAADEVAYVEETTRFPGGMGANVAVALAKLNIPVTLFGRIGSDSAGRLALENLSKNNVDTSNVHFVDASSLQTLILSDNQEHRWLFAVGSPQSAISITSPEEVNWKILTHCKVVYIGEVFVEIAAAVADYAKTRNKVAVYRPGVPYMKFGVENLHRVLEHTTIFILNQAGWRQLRIASEEKMNTPADLLKHGATNVVLTKGAEGCEVFSATKHLEISVAPQLRAKFKAIDSTGAGDGFSAGLIKALLRNWSFDKAINYAQAVASITCSRFGTSNAFPTEKEVAMNFPSN